MNERIRVFRFKVYDIATNDYAYGYATSECLKDNRGLIEVNDPAFPAMLVPVAEVNQHGFYRARQTAH